MEELQYSPAGKVRYRIYADVLMAFHTFWVFGIMVCGTLYILAPQAMWYLPWHALFVTATVLAYRIFRSCVCTTWEYTLRRKYDPETNFDRESFINTYLYQWLGVTIATHWIKYALNIAFIITWARIAYIYVLTVPT